MNNDHYDSYRDKTGRVGKLLRKLNEMKPKPGDVLYVGTRQPQTIQAALKRADIEADISKTERQTKRVDGVMVAVYQLTFK